MTNGCRRGSSKYAAVTADVIALMKRDLPGRDEVLLAVVSAAWGAPAAARAPRPRKTEAGRRGEGERGWH